MPVSTTFRLLDALVSRGFAQHDEVSGLYSVGIKAFEIGSRYVRNSVPEAALPAMHKLAGRLNESVNLAVRDGPFAVYVQQVEGGQRVRMFTRVGARVPLYCTGVGKALLAWDRQEHLDELRGIDWVPYTANTHKSMDTLRADLAKTQQTGTAIDDEEFESGVRCLAAPIRSRAGKVVAAVSVSAPTARFGHEDIPRFQEELLACAYEISSRLGWIDL